MRVAGIPWVLYGLYRIGDAITQRLSDASAERCARALAHAFYRLDGQGRANIRDNIRHVLGPEASAQRVEKVVRGVYLNMLRNYLDLFRFPRLTPAALRARVEIHGLDEALAALEAGKGLIGGSGVLADVFGAPARLPDGAVRLAPRTGAPLVLGFCRRKDRAPGHYIIRLQRVALPNGRRGQEAIREGLAHIIPYIEEAIAQSPEQWVMSVPLWKQ